jgi:septal ring factor EnvC (AmiA/AmiB activator)
MVNIDLIKTKLPQELREKAEKFMIPDEFLTSMPDLIILVLHSKSMDNPEEKQSWFTLLPMMNKDQIDKLRDILTREKQKLTEIEQKYEQKKDELKSKYSQKREDMVYAKRMEEIKQKEAEHEKMEDQQADNLLDQI